MRPTRLLLLAALAIVVVLSGSRAPDDDFYAMRKNFEIFGSFYEEIVGTYHLRVDPERFMRTGIDAMLTTLDPWTDFLDEADHVEMDLRGRRLLGDVGLNLGRRDGRITVLQPEVWSAAYRQGVRTGDHVVAVDGQPTEGLALPDVLRLLRGEPGTVVELSVDRDGGTRLDFALAREAPSIRNVAYAGVLPGGPQIVYLKLSVFGLGAASELAEAYRTAAAGRDVAGVVLDLRGNPGGLLSEAVAVSGLFLAQGTPVASTRGRTSDTYALYRTEQPPVVPDAPVALLMDRVSASASEIVAGALQDHDRAVVVGEQSFGKGLVQVVRPLPYSTSVKVTMSAYYTPSGRGIRRDGEGTAGSPSPFTTASGRPVREGFGIEPEVPVESRARGPLEEALEQEAAFFLYAGEIAARSGDALLAAAQASGQWSLEDGALDGFRSWLEARGFEYRTPLEVELASIDTGGASSAVQAAMERARSAAAGERELSWERERGGLTDRLAEETAARLLQPDERARVALPGDEVVRHAREVLTDAGRYADLLAPRRP